MTEQPQTEVISSLKPEMKKARLKVIELMGGKCKHCGFGDPRALQIDHVHGDGWAERRLARDLGLNYAISIRLVRESIERGENYYQLLCANCNWVKRVENKEDRKRIKRSILTQSPLFHSHFGCGPDGKMKARV